jgi:cysteinyl-tRNA synthetase, unknown class
MQKKLLIGLAVLLSVSCRKEKKTVEAAAEMQRFVMEISAYAKGIDPDFSIIPQNGEALCYLEANPDLDFATAYLNAIDGIGVEEIFYNGNFSEDTYRLDMLRELVGSKKIMVSEYVNDESFVADAIQKNSAEGFICFPRVANNYNYEYIPASPSQENADDVTTLQQVKNYLYLISNSQYSSKQSMIAAIAATNFDLVILDLFFEEEIFTDAEIMQLKTKANGGQRLVIAYMSIGSAEKYRYYWQDKWRLHNPNWLKKKYGGYKDEIWVEYWNPDWKNIIYGNDQSYLKKILNSGFDGVYLDNVEAYYFLYHRN